MAAAWAGSHGRRQSAELSDAARPSPYHVLDTLTFDHSDELWITGRAFHERADIVLRLFKTGDAPQHKMVRRAEVLAG